MARRSLIDRLARLTTFPVKLGERIEVDVAHVEASGLVLEAA